MSPGDRRALLVHPRPAQTDRSGRERVDVPGLAGPRADGGERGPSSLELPRLLQHLGSVEIRRESPLIVHRHVSPLDGAARSGIRRATHGRFGAMARHGTPVSRRTSCRGDAASITDRCTPTLGPIHHPPKRTRHETQATSDRSDGPGHPAPGRGGDVGGGRDTRRRLRPGTAGGRATAGYHISIHTANVDYAGTDGDVWLRVHGTYGSTDYWKLDDSADNYERNRTDQFTDPPRTSARSGR